MTLRIYPHHHTELYKTANREIFRGIQQASVVIQRTAACRAANLLGLPVHQHPIQALINLLQVTLPPQPGTFYEVSTGLGRIAGLIPIIAAAEDITGKF
jgi:hypothetical protein